MRKYSVQETNNIALGQLGFDELTIPLVGSATATGDWVAIKAVGGNALISTILTSIGDDIETGEGLDPFEIEDGEVLYATITSVTPTEINGNLIAYRR
jgi:hypothetical protein|tara:strand:- start:652 stop:945 length:294 start_codon:yes stop_codon:yes gene_type:complete